VCRRRERPGVSIIDKRYVHQENQDLVSLEVRLDVPDAPAQPATHASVLIDRRHPHALTRRSGLTLAAVCAVPVAFLLAFIAVYGVNVAFHDELGMNWFLEGARLGWLKPSHIWQQHNEHRIIFPRFVWLVMLAYLTNWNSKSVMFFSVAMALVAWLVIARMAWRQRTGAHEGLFFTSLACSSLVYFSIAQYGNWLAAFQMALFMVQLWVALAVFFATRPDSSRLLRVGLAALFCFLASFSSAHGLMSWLAVAPALWAMEDAAGTRRRVLALWTALFVVTGAIYSLGFHLPEGDGFPDWRYPLQHPDLGILWFLGLLGNPLTVELGAYRPRIAATVGTVLLALYVALVWRGMRARAHRLIAPWAALGLFAILFAFVTTVARSGWGPGGYLSRHTTPAVFLILAVIQGWAAFLAHRPVAPAWSDPVRERPLNALSGGTAWRWIYGLVLIGCVLLTLASTVGVLAIAGRWKADKDLARRVMPFGNYLDPSIDGLRSGVLFPLWPTPGHLKVLPMIEGAARGGFVKLVKDASFADDQAGGSGRIERVTVAGTTSTAGPPPATAAGGAERRDVRLSGWALKPGRGKPAELVFLGCRGSRRFLSAVRVGAERPELARTLGVGDARIGWEASVAGELLPPSGCELDAWVYDRYENRFVRLSGVHGAERP
jgi:hypothetical protein